MMVSEWANRTREYAVEYWADEQWHSAYSGSGPLVAVESDPAAPTGANGWHTSSVTLNFTATGDADEAPSVEVSINGGDFAAHEGSLSPDQDAVDEAGNATTPTYK